MVGARDLGESLMVSPVYLAVHVPEFSAQALLRLRPELRRKPVAVVKGVPPLQQVCSANPEARAMGVENGITRAQLDAFDGLSIFPHPVRSMPARALRCWKLRRCSRHESRCNPSPMQRSPYCWT